MPASPQQKYEQLMIGQLTTVPIDNLEQAIKIVIHDARIPKTLRTALGVYGAQSAELNKSEVGTMRYGKTEPTRRPGIIGSSDSEPRPCNSPSFAHEDSLLLSCESAAIDQRLMLRIQYNKQSLDWSVEINELRHEGITKDDMEALVECAVIFAEMKIIRALCQRLQ
jgi:hypothetical protein